MKIKISYYSSCNKIFFRSCFREKQTLTMFNKKKEKKERATYAQFESLLTHHPKTSHIIFLLIYYITYISTLYIHKMYIYIYSFKFYF